MSFLLLCTYLGVAAGAILKTGIVKASNTDEPGQLDYIELSSYYNLRNPLFAPTGIPETVRTSAASINSGPEPPFRVSIQQNYPSSLVLIPAELQFNRVWRTHFTSSKKPLDISDHVSDLQKEDLAKAEGFTIERVPEIASYTKFGPLLPSDIPTISEIEKIFDSATRRTTDENKVTTEYSQPIKDRISFEEADNDNVTSDILTQTSATSSPIQTVRVSQDTENTSAITDSEATTKNKELQNLSDEIIARPLSIALDNRLALNTTIRDDNFTSNFTEPSEGRAIGSDEDISDITEETQTESETETTTLEVIDVTSVSNDENETGTSSNLITDENVVTLVDSTEDYNTATTPLIPYEGKNPSLDLENELTTSETATFNNNIF